MVNRTSKSVQGTQRSALRIDEILPKMLVEISQRASLPREAIFQEWAFVSGDKIASLTQPVSFTEGVLTVKVKSSTLYSLLCQHEKPRLLRRLQEKFSIRDIVFRIG